jgi:hypothetical protein
VPLSMDDLRCSSGIVLETAILGGGGGGCCCCCGCGCGCGCECDLVEDLVECDADEVRLMRSLEDRSLVLLWRSLRSLRSLLWVRSVSLSLSLSRSRSLSLPSFLLRGLVRSRSRSRSGSRSFLRRRCESDEPSIFYHAVPVELLRVARCTQHAGGDGASGASAAVSPVLRVYGAFDWPADVVCVARLRLAGKELSIHLGLGQEVW